MSQRASPKTRACRSVPPVKFGRRCMMVVALLQAKERQVWPSIFQRKRGMDMERNSSSIWPYVIAGSAIGSAVGYLVISVSRKKTRKAGPHPHVLVDAIED